MMDVFDTAIQIVSLLICLAISLWFIYKTRDKAWVLLNLFYVSYLLGDLYWQAVAFYYGDTPQISVVSDLSWYASYIFLILFIFMECERRLGRDFQSLFDKAGFKRFIPYLAYPFAAGMAVLYMQIGKPVSNTIYAIITGVLLYCSIRNVLFIKDRYIRNLNILVIINCFGEYGSWTSSFFREDADISNPYYWFNALISLCFPIYLIIKGKEVAT